MDVALTPAQWRLLVDLELTRRRLREGRIKVVRGTCPELVSQFESYVWADDAKDDERPVRVGEDARGRKHAFDALDAARYMVMALDYQDPEDHPELLRAMFAGAA